MLQLIDPAARGIAAATLIGALLLASPLRAATIDRLGAAPAQLAQATPPAAPPAATPKKPRRSPVDRVEERIKVLHDALQITPAQEPQWAAVVQAMREHAQMMGQAIQQREQNPAMNAVDDLKAYEAIVDANAQGMQKLVPAFQVFYASLSDDQKKKADVLFSRAHHHRSRSKKQ
jgi:periplasmic protein CpxP/Spy